MHENSEVTIEVCGQDRTRQIRDWTLELNSKRDGLLLTCHFRSGKTFTRSIDDCRVSPIRKVRDVLVASKGGSVHKTIEEAVVYGERFIAGRRPGSPEMSLWTLADIDLIEQWGMEKCPVFQHFIEVAEARIAAATEDQRQIAENIQRQLVVIPASRESALHAYCSGVAGALGSAGALIYPFGVNESQLKAVEQAFTSQISMIEGPPGTGKTQTILNIVANALVRGKTVAVVSNNNAAVKNVYEKLAASGLSYLVAQLGNRENQKEFFENLPSMPTEDPEVAPTQDDIQTILAKLKRQLRAQNEVARLQAELDEMSIERGYLLEWRNESGLQDAPPLAHYALSPRKTTDLMAYLSYLAGERIRLKDRIELVFKFRIFRVAPFDGEQRRLAFFHALQLNYYDKAIEEKQAALATSRKILEEGNFKGLLKELTVASMKYLKWDLHGRIEKGGVFDQKSYRKKFDAFLRRFPIIGSGTHSIVNSMEKGAILDYIIIDEASQQDIIPGILALGCARNLVVVGDSKQLAHIPVALGLSPPSKYHDCEKYSLLDSCAGVFGQMLPKTLLKEHYRCHPKIIQFCNQQFYGNQLVPMREDAGEHALHLATTAKGNHTRRNANLREIEEIESLMAIIDGDGERVGLDEEGRGFIAPFRAQVNLSAMNLSGEIVKDTVHKFQGRECNDIIFSTVLDKKRTSQRLLEFVDDARMVNVAVSRAKHRFVLATGDGVFSESNGHIAALIRYIKYYAGEAQIARSPIVSAFDLLYTEFDESLVRLNERLRKADSRYKSEQIVAELLRGALSNEACNGLMFHMQVLLSQLAGPGIESLTHREHQFMKNRTSCDFVIYYRVGKTPLGVIEVDGGCHDRLEQARRDALKNSILEKCGIPLLRLRTVESRIETRIVEFLSQWARCVEAT